MIERRKAEIRIPEETMTEFIYEFRRLRNCIVCRKNHPEKSINGGCKYCTPQQVVSDHGLFLREIYKGLINQARSEMIKQGREKCTLEFEITFIASNRDLNKWLRSETYLEKYNNNKEENLHE